MFFHVLPSKIHILGWEVFFILVSVFKLPVNHWHHRLAFTLKINPEFWLKSGMRKVRHPCTLPVTTDAPKTGFVPGGKAEEQQISPIYNKTFQRTT